MGPDGAQVSQTTSDAVGALNPAGLMILVVTKLGFSRLSLLSGNASERDGEPSKKRFKKRDPMKVYRICTVAAAALAGLLAVTNASAAQDTNTTRRVERRGPTVQQRVERMTTELQLNDDQKTKVTALLEKQSKERREIMGDSALPREDRRDKMRALTEDENKQLKTILTPEQFEKWQKLREQMRARRPGGPAQPGVAAPAPAPAPEPKTPDNKSQ